MGRKFAHSLIRVAAAVVVGHGLPASITAPSTSAQGLSQPLQVTALTAAFCQSSSLIHIVRHPALARWLRSSAQGSQSEGGLVQEPALTPGVESAGKTRLHGCSKKQAIAPNSEPTRRVCSARSARVAFVSEDNIITRPPLQPAWNRWATAGKAVEGLRVVASGLSAVIAQRVRRAAVGARQA